MIRGTLLAVLALALAEGDASPSLRAVSLRTEYLVNPLAVDTRNPRLSWKLVSAARGDRQTAYRILAATAADVLAGDRGDLWDTGRVESGRSFHIEYAGKPLRAKQLVFWKVRVWDRRGRPSPWSETAFFRTGLLGGPTAARWIGPPGPPPRLRPAHNGYHSAFARRADEPKWVAVDLGGVRRIDAVRLHPARPYDWKPDTPGFLFPLRFRIEVSRSGDFNDARIAVDRTRADVPSPGTNPLELRFEPAGARAVRIVVTRLRRRDDANYAFALAELEVLSEGKNLARGARVTALDSIEGGGWSAHRLTDGDLTSHPAEIDPPRPAPLLRRTFRLESPPRRATVIASALGLYELRVNGQRAGKDHLAPGWTDYRRRVHYQAYDVTSHLVAGENVLAAVLADGWYAGRIGLTGIAPESPPRGVYGPVPRFLLELEIEEASGAKRTIATDASWKVHGDGPIRSASILDGETVDLRRVPEGWDRAGYDDSAWEAAAVDASIDVALGAEPCEPIRPIAEIPTRRITEPRAGIYVFDLGRNFAGWVRLRARGERGTEIVLRHGEMLREDGRVYTENLRSALQTDRFILRGGGEEILEPRFTYHGFRYVEVEGLASPPSPEDLTGVAVGSAVREAGGFECSEPLLNRLMDAVSWTIRSNLHSVPTDCPQRDERMGWLGDAQVISHTAAFRFDMAAFFTKWLSDIRDAQAPDGRFPDFAPHPYRPELRFSGAPGWADAGAIIPWRMWVHYADRRALAGHFDAVRRWVDFVRARNPGGIWREARGNDYGDWLNGDTLRLEGWPRRGAAVPRDVFATAFFAHSAELAAKMARVLGRRDDAAQYEALARRIRERFREEFVSEDGRIAGDTQAGYALALHFDLLPAALRPRALGLLVEGIARYKGHLSTGIQSAGRAMLELTRGGHTDLAYALALERTFPSWGAMLEAGATTIWERWDGYVPGRGFQDPGMNSFNHYAFGAVGEWLFRTVLGIEPLEEYPGFERFRLHPRPGGGLTWARGHHDSIRGRIAVAWRLGENGGFTLDAEVPPGVTAEVVLPAPEDAEIRESGRPAAEAREVTALGRTETEARFEVQSGKYHFEVRAP